MQRRTGEPRANWQRTVERQGLVFHHWRDGDLLRQYWDEGHHYALTPAEAAELRTATDELHGMCLRAMAHAVDCGRLGELGIPVELAPYVEASWRRGDPSLYGRFDLVYDGSGPPKLLEYNADTPTCLLEAAVVQWQWAQEVHPEASQFNAVHDHLIAAWDVVGARLRTPGGPAPVVHVAHETDGYAEEYLTAVYLQDVAAQAGLDARSVRMSELDWDDAAQRFVDPQGTAVRHIFKLYPWEWMLAEDFGPQLRTSLQTTSWIEPLWKLALSNKALLTLLWELFPDSPYLLPAYLDTPRELTRYARKPLFGREGANITLVRDGDTLTTDGPYADDRFVYQQLCELPSFSPDRWTVLGSWVVGHRACGIGIRESPAPVTDDKQLFVPHVVTD